jgi:hypothetical protein
MIGGDYRLIHNNFPEIFSCVPKYSQRFEADTLGGEGLRPYYFAIRPHALQCMHTPADACAGIDGVAAQAKSQIPRPSE